MHSVISIVAAAIAVYLTIRLLTAPIRWAWKIAINTVCGFLLMTLANTLSAYTGFVVEITLLRAFIVGVTGLPGFIGVVLWDLFM